MIPFSAEGGHCTGSCGSSYSKMVWKRDKKEGWKKEAMRRQPHIIHLESRWRWRNFLRKLLFNCSGFRLGSETATTTQVLEMALIHSGKKDPKKATSALWVCQEGSPKGQWLLHLWAKTVPASIFHARQDLPHSLFYLGCLHPGELWDHLKSGRWWKGWWEKLSKNWYILIISSSIL